METQPTPAAPKKHLWMKIILFLFGIGMLLEAFAQTNPISIATAVIVGGLLVIFVGKDIWQNNWKK